MSNLYEELKRADIPMPTKSTETFRMIRWGRNNRYWLRKFEGGYVFGDFVTGVQSHCFDKDFRGRYLESARQKMQETMQLVENRTRKIHEVSASRALILWSSAKPVSQNRYLKAKKVRNYNLKEHNGHLLLPLVDNGGKIWSLQFISDAGEKKFLSGGRKKGCYFTIGEIEKAERICICEGYATGASIYESTEIPVIVAFDACNLEDVAKAIRAKNHEAEIIICADNDCYHESGINPGLEKAKKAAESVGARVVFPTFKDVSTHPTDFNDLFVQEGAAAVKAIVEAVNDETNASADIEEKEKNEASKNMYTNDFKLTDEGLFWEDGRSKKVVKISDYIRVVAFTKSSNGVAKLVEFRDYKGELKQLILKSQMLAKDGEQIRIALVNQGFTYAGSLFSKRKLFEYISSSCPKNELLLLSRMGFFEATYIRPDGVIGETEQKILLDPSVQDESLSTSGTLQLWNDMVARWCMGNSRLIFAISAGFASLLLKACDVPNVGFHFVGNSSSGKTTCLNVAASVFGNPKYVVTWKATDNALENIAFRRNDSLLILDELSEISASKAGDVAYMLANGEGKKRLDKNCNARETFSWRLIFLSSGEVDLTSHMAEESKTSKAGQKVRLLNISANPSKYSCGIFENLMGFQDGAEFSGFLRENASKYYGTASIAFINQVLKHHDMIKSMYKEEFQRLKSQYLPEDASGQDLRAFEHFMFVGFAGELAIKWGVVCWKSGTACCAAVDCFNSWLEDKDGVGDDENRQILDHVKSFFELHSHSRFYELGSYSDQKISNMAGYRKTFEDGFNFYVSPSVFQNEICKGFRRKSVIQLLIDKGFLLRDHNGEYRQQKWTPDGNKKVYVISGKVLA